MKIKLFEEYSVGYISITEDEYDEYCTDVHTEEWYRNHINVFNKEDDVASKYFDFKLNKATVNVLQSSDIDFKLNKATANVLQSSDRSKSKIEDQYLYYARVSDNLPEFTIKIYKTQDDWYYVRVFGSVNHRNNQIGFRLNFYKCDQLYGLEECLKMIRK